MTGYERQDERMADWLEQGPWDPPPAAIDSAVAYARSHPHHAPRLGGLWRHVMSGIRLTPVQQHPASNRSLLIAMATVAAVVVVTIGLVGAMNLLGPPAQPGGAGTPTEAPSALPTPVPTAAGLPVQLTGGLGTCETVHAGTERVIEALESPAVTASIAQTRGVSIRCTVDWSDPRLKGSISFTYNAEGPDARDLETWGTVRLATDDGAWSGVWRGNVAPFSWSLYHELNGVLIGQGPYDGLRVRWSIDNFSKIGGATTVIDDDRRISSKWRLSGILETIDTTPSLGTTLISGSSTCRQTEPGTETVVGEITQVRGAALTCSGNVGSDPRLDGIGRTTINGDQQLDGSARLWGIEEIIVDDQVTWRGDYAGTVAAGYTTHRLAGSDIGYGPYAGLVYDWTMIGDPATGYVNSGTIREAR